MEHYVTLFDGLFLPQGLALYRSMQRHAGPFRLWVLCMDDAAFEVLQRLDLPNLRVIPLKDAESAELLRAKPSRTRGEYCWTMTPATPKLVFERDASARRVTYLDADMWFRLHPGAVFDQFERSGKAVLITEHAYPPEFDQSKASGRFCVQFVTFVRDRSEPVRSWWAERCIEWCYSRTEDGKFGDQMYLDDWPTRFGGLVHVLDPAQWVQGPWNTTRSDPAAAACFHFHGLRILRDRDVLLTETYPIYRHTREVLYGPYLQDLTHAVHLLRGVGMPVKPQLDRPLWRQRLRVLAKSVYLASRGNLMLPTDRFGKLA
jgi:hypothetical protein